ncbi:MAG: hypothetical protein PUK14_04800 [Clostridiales bacterium]|nr:hypothetical protein [Clostridiales bacterium]MDY6116547.1 hypothetical protein [Anaerovoracaceae bacterium]
MRYYGILPKRKLWVKIAAIALGVIAAYDAYINGNWFYVPFGIILIIATFSSRTQVISENGVDIEYRLLGHCFHNNWSYDDILAVHKDSLKSAPNIEIHINKGAINRRFIFSPDDADAVFALIQKSKPGIIIKEVNHN